MKNQPSDTIRLSYSLLDLWKRGRKEEAIKLYLHVEDREPTPAMKRGIEFDRFVKETVDTEGRLPKELGGATLDRDVHTSEKVVVPFKGFDLSAEYDIRAGSDIIELKCSEVMDSAEYLTTLQLPFYLFTAHLTGIKPNRGMIYRYDPVHRLYDISIMYPNDRVYQEVSDEIDTHGREIVEYFREQGVI